MQISKITSNDNNSEQAINLNGEYLKIFLKFGGFFPEFIKEDKVKEKYSLFFNIKRFSIPVFDTISCGKSLFLLVIKIKFKKQMKAVQRILFVL